MNIAELFAQRERERYALNNRFLNDQMVRVLQAIGYDIGFCRGEGQYLYTRDGNRYLDLLSGYGVFAIGRNHPKLREALKSVLDADLPNLIQMDVSALAGILAERLLTYAPYLDKALFVNSGSEAVEAAIKLARAATGRTGIVYCDHAFHGLSHGALSLNGDEIFRNGFEPLLPDCVRIPFNDLLALEKALHARTAAAFIVSPCKARASICLPTTTSERLRLSAVDMEAYLWPMKSKPEWDALAASSQLSTGTWNLTWYCWPKLCPEDTFRWALSLPAEKYFTKSSIAWTARWSTDRPSAPMTWQWRPELQRSMYSSQNDWLRTPRELGSI